jgi:hypothetical protein
MHLVNTELPPNVTCTKCFYILTLEDRRCGKTGPMYESDEKSMKEVSEHWTGLI